MPSSVTIREAVPSDADRIAALISSLAREFIVPDAVPDVQSRFLSAVDAAAIAQHMRGPFRYHVLLISDELVGVVGIRSCGTKSSISSSIWEARAANSFGMGHGIARRERGTTSVRSTAIC